MNVDVSSSSSAPPLAQKSSSGSSSANSFSSDDSGSDSGSGSGSGSDSDSSSYRRRSKKNGDEGKDVVSVFKRYMKRHPRLRKETRSSYCERAAEYVQGICDDVADIWDVFNQVGDEYDVHHDVDAWEELEKDDDDEKLSDLDKETNWTPDEKVALYNAVWKDVQQELEAKQQKRKRKQRALAQKNTRVLGASTATENTSQKAAKTSRNGTTNLPRVDAPTDSRMCLSCGKLKKKD